MAFAYSNRGKSIEVKIKNSTQFEQMQIYKALRRAWQDSNLGPLDLQLKVAIEKLSRYLQDTTIRITKPIGSRDKYLILP